MIGGLGYVVHDRPDAFGYAKGHDQHAIQSLMPDLLAPSSDPEHWPTGWPQFILSATENGCCEFAKHRSA